MRLYREQGYPESLPWSCMTCADVITREWARKARSAGCVHVGMGVETWNEDYRRRVYAKHISNRQFSDAAAALHEAGIYFTANMIVGGLEKRCQVSSEVTRACLGWIPCS